MRKQPNNYFHVRVYTDSGSKLEVYRDKAKPSTRREIVDGLRRAIEIVEKLDEPEAASPLSEPESK